MEVINADLKSLAKLAGYPVAAILKCGQFKCTHHFIMEAWEATYCGRIDQYINMSVLNHLMRVKICAIWKFLNMCQSPG